LRSSPLPSFSKRSLDKLHTCDPRLQKLFKEVIHHYDCTILEGRRSAERQQELYDLGFSRTATNSAHLKGSMGSLAVDVVPFPFRSKDWRNMKRFYHFAGFVTATCKQMQRDGRLDASWRLISGLDWDGDNDLDDQGFMDGPHFEIDVFAERA